MAELDNKKVILILGITVLAIVLIVLMRRKKKNDPGTTKAVLSPVGSPIATSGAPLTSRDAISGPVNNVVHRGGDGLQRFSSDLIASTMVTAVDHEDVMARSVSTHKDTDRDYDSAEYVPYGGANRSDLISPSFNSTQRLSHPTPGHLMVGAL